STYNFILPALLFRAFLSLSLIFSFFPYSPHSPSLPSFPTRRSSDLLLSNRYKLITNVRSSLMAVNIHITIIELNALHTKRQNLFQELDAVIHLLMEAKHWGLRKSRNATSLNSRFKSLLSLRSSRSSYFATFRHQLTILSKTDALDEEKWLNMLGTFVKDWFRYESHFVHGRDSLVDILKERGLLSESDAVQPLIGKKS